MKVLPNTKLGQPSIAPVVRNSSQVEITTGSFEDNELTGAIGNGIVGSANVLGTKVEAKLDIKRERKDKSSANVTRKVVKAESSEFYHVRAIGNDNWKIIEENGATLDGVYIDHLRLCELAPLAGSNRLGVEIELLVKQKHIKATMVQENRWKEMFATLNHRKVASILMAKSLHANTSPKIFDGTFIFARTQDFDEV